MTQRERERERERESVIYNLRKSRLDRIGIPSPKQISALEIAPQNQI